MLRSLCRLHSDLTFQTMPLKIRFNMTWFSSLSQRIIFRVRKGNNELTDCRLCCLLFGYFPTGYFEGLLGFEAKDLKMCPRILHLWYIV